MSIYEELDNATCHPNEHMSIQNALRSFEDLGSYLSNQGSPYQVLKILRVELETRNRPSYVQRIYGRYRKLLPAYDLRSIDRWVKKKAQSKSTSTKESEPTEGSQENTPAQGGGVFPTGSYSSKGSPS